MHFTVAHDSRIGRRNNNQDRLAWGQSDHAIYLVVADGMGGHRLGEVAAQLAVQKFGHSFALEARPRLDDPRKFLQRMMYMIHESINDHALMRTIPVADAPRTTCVACVIQDGTAHWVHVGDSRLFLIRNSRLLVRTQDHSRVQALIDAGEITAEEAQLHPQRNLVTTCLGGDMIPRVDISPGYVLEPGDTLALCSDGIWAHLTDILPVALSRPLEQAVAQIMDQAEQLNGPNGDNLSLLTLRWESGRINRIGEVSTRPFDPSQTIIENLRPETSKARALSDAEIMSAIETIRNNLKKNRPPETTK
jgi:serine/threonine protein phosphatase PrpC